MLFRDDEDVDDDDDDDDDDNRTSLSISILMPLIMYDQILFLWILVILQALDIAIGSKTERSFKSDCFLLDWTISITFPQ